MRAARFHGPERGVVVEEVPTPDPGPGEALVRVAACGVCHTDLHYLDHGTPTFRDPPLVLGHEVAGTVEAVGPEVDDGRVGDRILVPALLTCGSCEACRSGRENLCRAGRMPGNHLDGGYAELMVVPARDLVELPEEIPLVEAAIIADALTTPYHAVVRRGGVEPADPVAVVGCGGIGLNVVQTAAALGARVTALDVDPGKLEWARRLGAEHVLNSSVEDRPDRAVRRLTGGGVAVAFEAVGKPGTQELALGTLRAGGRLVLVGYSPEVMPLNAGRVMFRELDVVGSLGCRPVDYPRVVELVRRGKLELEALVTHRFALEEIEEAFDALRAGEPVRAVVVP